jgi:hypothetical protein
MLSRYFDKVRLMEREVANPKQSIHLLLKVSRKTAFQPKKEIVTQIIYISFVYL